MMMTSQDYNSPEGEETCVEWTEESSRNYVASLKRDLVSILRNPERVASDMPPHARKLVILVYSLRKELISWLEGGASRGEE